jgi:predicted type IV restriction endonuclease
MRHETQETQEVDMPYSECWNIERFLEHLRTLSTEELERLLNIYEDRSSNNRAIRIRLEAEIATSEYDEIEMLKNITEYHKSYRDQRCVYSAIEMELDVREDHRENYDE